ncbi:MAG TPA: YaaA family protein [Candidatus Mediterraneibacter cottocaccae]|nr:YaaA family protein [Candidatus Mediterraneibacter cottocaccae]
MKIIISPAKKMKNDPDLLQFRDYPVFLEKTEILMDWIRSLSYEEAKRVWKCNDKIAEQNFERFARMDLKKNLTPAILSYEGIQYQYMAPAVFEEKAVDYIQEHLRILSGFYGVLKPLDGVTPYRLEMQAKIPEGESKIGAKDLYAFWGRTICDEVLRDERAALNGNNGYGGHNAHNGTKKDCTNTIINLASKEYSRCVEAYLGPEDRFLTCVFGELSDGKVKQKGTFAKMARGEMVRFLAQRQAEDPEEMKAFDRLGYRFSQEYSSENEYVFLKEEREGDK